MSKWIIWLQVHDLAVQIRGFECSDPGFEHFLDPGRFEVLLRQSHLGAGTQIDMRQLPPEHAYHYSAVGCTR